MKQEELMEEMRAIAEKYFDTKDDPEQIPINKASADKLMRLDPHSVTYRLVDGHPVSWVIVLPTTRALAQDFVAGKINEHELFDLTEPQKIYDALYFCSAFTIPQYRRQGLAEELNLEAYKNIPHTKDCYCCCWPFSPEGKRLAQDKAKKWGIDLIFKK